MAQDKTKSSRTKKIIIALWSLFGIGTIIIILALAVIYNGKIGYMPPVEELKNA